MTAIQNALTAGRAFIGGHVTLSEVDLLVGPLPDVLIFSCVRNPIERLLSLYLFNKRVPVALGSVYEATKGRDFDYFYSHLTERYPHVARNAQCQYLGGFDFKTALPKIHERFHMIVDHKRIDDLLAFLSARMGGQPETAPRLNSNPDSASQFEVVAHHVSRSLARRICIDNAEDLAVCHYIQTTHSGVFTGDMITSRPPGLGGLSDPPMVDLNHCSG